MQGLKPSQLSALTRLFNRRFPAEDVYTLEQAREIALLSRAVGRQIGLLVDRKGRVQTVIVGEAGGLLIPELPRTRGGAGRLRGLRLVHTHLTADGLSQEDLMDMLFLRLDAVIALTVSPAGEPVQWQAAHLLPENVNGQHCHVGELRPWNHTQAQLAATAKALEDELDALAGAARDAGDAPRALLASASMLPAAVQERNIGELAELARTAGLTVVGHMTQRLSRADPRFILGKGKMAELEVLALQTRADMLVFDGELSPAQLHNLADITERKVIDRTQLILDIFARRARSREGKLQIEMAQLKYMLPRLGTRDDALSRLTGGIGARGPGETRLEIDKRRINDRIARLARELKNVGQERYRRRGRRRKREVPVISLVGYTNAGKSTLLNTLTHSDILAEDLLFATLDPSSRRLRFPEDMEVIITDTVGFIRNLPAELLKAFASTLEELREADLILHVIDRANPEWRQQAEVVADLLTRLELDSIPCIRVLNKMDLLGEAEKEKALQEGALHGDIGISAMDSASLRPLLGRAEKLLRSQSDRQFFASAQVLK